MNEDILIELRFFAVSLYWGMLLLVLYDVLRILRRVIKHNNFLIAIQDIIYWVTCGILIFHMMYQQNNGIIRGFSILAMSLGMLLYHAVFSNFLVDNISALINKIITVITKILKLIFKPIYIIFHTLERFFKFINKNLRNKYQSMLKALKNKKKSSKIEESENEKGD